MNGERISQWVRGILLTGLLLAFAITLGRSLMVDHAAAGFGRNPQGLGEDPGVRVLLANRQPGDPTPTFDKIVVEALQTMEVVAPDAPLEKREVLKPGAKLRIEVVGTEGFFLSSADWGRDVRLTVQTFYLVPKLANAVPKLDRDGNPQFTPPRTYEAADARAVFRLIAAERGQRLASYRGSLQVLWNSAKDLRLINHLPMESYLEGVVATEMSPSYPIEALKAQAIASRGFAQVRCQVGAKRAWDLSDTAEDQEYHGAGFSTAAVVRSVFETRGVVPTIHGTPFLPMFSAASGGYTAAISSVFPNARDAAGREPLDTVMGARPDPYFQAGIAGLGLAATHGRSQADLKPRDIQKRLAEALASSGRQVGFINNIRVGARDPRSNRVLTVLVYHTLDQQPLVVPAATFRNLVGPSLVRSTLWSNDSPKRVEANGSYFWRIFVAGWGHGVGLSQVSAWEMARQGYYARQIIETFYQDAELKTLW